MKTILIVIFLLNHVLGGKYQKCGFETPKCQILSNGKIYYPKSYNTSCSLAPICPPEYKLHKTRIGDLRACCCRYKSMATCPDCDMTKNGNFSEWIDLHLLRDGPPEGTCKGGKIKRIFIPIGKGRKGHDKCCCEPRNSPYIFATET